MRRVAAIAAVLGVAVASAAASPAGLPGARAIKICAAAGPYWPTMTLALNERPPGSHVRRRHDSCG